MVSDVPVNAQQVIGWQPLAHDPAAMMQAGVEVVCHQHPASIGGLIDGVQTAGVWVVEDSSHRCFQPVGRPSCVNLRL